MPSKSKPQQRLMQATDTDAAYMAGFFDGEGHLTLAEHNRPGHASGSDRRTPHYRLHLGITNRDVAVLHWMRQRIGGSVIAKSRQNDKWATAFELRLWNRTEIENFLRLIQPYSQIKQRQIQLGLAFLALGLSRVTFSARGKTWPRRIQHPDDVEAKRAIKEQFHVLNMKGSRAS